MVSRGEVAGAGMVTAGNIKNGLPFLGIVQVERRPILTVRVFFSRRGGENDLVRNPLQQNAAYLQFQLDPRFASGAAAGNTAACKCGMLCPIEPWKVSARAQGKILS